MFYEKLHDSSYPNAEHLDRLHKDVDACNENYTKVIVSWKNNNGADWKDVFAHCIIMDVLYKKYKKAFKETIENSDKAIEETIENSDSSSDFSSDSFFNCLF